MLTLGKYKNSRRAGGTIDIIGPMGELKGYQVCVSLYWYWGYVTWDFIIGG